MLLPKHFESYRVRAEKLIADGGIKEVVFSGGTYQVLVFDPKTQEEYWAFVQLDSGGNPKDYFCSCETPEELCDHITVAYLRVYNHYRQPLHQRFSQSIWNRIGRICSDRQRADLTSNQSGVYETEGLKIEGKTSSSKKGLEEIIQQHPEETEENSIKFSELSPEEIENWREGKPSARLRYLLSYWNELAKWLMVKQDDRESLHIQFTYREDGLPKGLIADFETIALSCSLSQDELSELIPTLSTVESPLTVHDNPHETIESIYYDEEKGELVIQRKSNPIEPKNENFPFDNAIELEGWWFVPNDGFYVKDQQHQLDCNTLAPNRIAQVLDENFAVIQSLLQGAQVHEEPVQPKYQMRFDEQSNLHIHAYLFTVGDLQQLHSRQFREWIYLPGDGFYRLKDSYFEEIDVVIPQESVIEFITQNRAWLNAQEGFETHITNVETRVEFTLDEDNRLKFIRLGDVQQGQDFGQWIYIHKEGFYRKAGTQLSIPFNQTIPQDQIPVFIRDNRPELELIPGFFSDKCPMKQSSLRIDLSDDEIITVTPYFERQPDYEGRDVRIFEDFTYVEGEGFHELPISLRLPERYHHPVTLVHDNLSVFLNVELEDLEHLISYMDPRLVKPEEIHLFADAITRAEQRGSYKLKLRYHTERGNITVSDIWTGMTDKKRFLFTDAGLIDLHESRFNWIRPLKKKQLDRRSNILTLSAMEFLRLNVFEEVQIKKTRSPKTKQSIAILEELKEFQTPDKPNTTGLASHLREYQETGLEWLWFLYHHGLSGLLCDDMGLGKTHQAMALMAAIDNDLQLHNPKQKRHYLVICPTSVIYHWEEKLEMFLPKMKVCTFHGANRSIKDFRKDYDVLLTSYGVWRNEHNLLSEVPFELAIFDEVQIAKNRTSRTHHALTQVNAQMRLGLTGTPIENYLKELKALFDLVIPGYMPSTSDFKDYFIIPIEKQGNVERRLLLSRFIKPFILRRKKGDVLDDLPVKIEEISHCELEKDQYELYNNILEQSRQKVIHDLQNGVDPIPYVHIFAILSGLKQICNHPAAYLKCPEDYKEYKSGKWELFVELLNEARQSSQKVVVFSQYLAMLDIIQNYLRDAEIPFASVRGATTDRAHQIRSFNKDPECEVFVGSLQAVGLGVDLTAGSVVIHYDRWWNAAREDQATDRVHRIGQTRGVQVFKLVTKGTFEERIDTLIAKKGKLMEDVIGTDDHQVVKKFERDELIDLLQFYKPE